MLNDSTEYNFGPRVLKFILGRFQILQAKVQRLEHLLHLKDIRIDDLQARGDHLEKQLQPKPPQPKQ